MLHSLPEHKRQQLLQARLQSQRVSKLVRDLNSEKELQLDLTHLRMKKVDQARKHQIEQQSRIKSQIRKDLFERQQKLENRIRQNERRISAKYGSDRKQREKQKLAIQKLIEEQSQQLVQNQNRLREIEIQRRKIESNFIEIEADKRFTQQQANYRKIELDQKWCEVRSKLESRPKSSYLTRVAFAK